MERAILCAIVRIMIIVLCILNDSSEASYLNRLVYPFLIRKSGINQAINGYTSL